MLLFFNLFELVNSLLGFWESRRTEEDLNHSMKIVVSDFSIKGFYFSSLALADDSPPTVFSSQIYSLQRALQLILKEVFFSPQFLRPFYIIAASQNPKRRENIPKSSTKSVAESGLDQSIWTKI